MTGDRVDLGTIDILRDRERGVARYNDFREKLRKPRVERFEDLTDNAEWAEEIRDVYDGDIDRVDLQVGMLAEPLPPGFGFSDTAFRIFILMASRRLRSDRFFTDDYSPDVYIAGGHRLGREQHDEGRAAAPPPRAGARAGGRRQRVRAVAQGRLRRGDRQLMARELPRASLVENARFNALVVVPNAVQGIFRRRPARGEGRHKAGVDRWAVRLLDGMRRSHGPGPVWIRVLKDPALLVLSRDGVRRVLGGSPDPFAPDPEAKRDGMVAFQPDALTISRGGLWENRRRFTEAVLDTGRPLHRLADRFAQVAPRGGRGAAARVPRRGGRARVGAVARGRFGLTTRRVVLGDSARDDEELSELLAELMSEANKMPGKPVGAARRVHRAAAPLRGGRGGGQPREPVRRRAVGRAQTQGRGPDPALAVRDAGHAGDQLPALPGAAGQPPAPARRGGGGAGASARRVDTAAGVASLVPRGLPRGGDAAVAHDADALPPDDRGRRLGRRRPSRPAHRW